MDVGNVSDGIGETDGMNMLRYLKTHRRGHGFPRASDGWGPITVYLEIEDQRARRQVNVHEAGQILRYDRSHWADDFGMMFMCLFSRKQKAAGSDGEFIDPADFEKQWRRALAHGMWEEQLARSRQDEWGTWEEKISW